MNQKTSIFLDLFGLVLFDCFICYRIFSNIIFENELITKEIILLRDPVFKESNRHLRKDIELYADSSEFPSFFISHYDYWTLNHEEFLRSVKKGSKLKVKRTEKEIDKGIRQIHSISKNNQEFIDLNRRNFLINLSGIPMLVILIPMLIMRLNQHFVKNKTVEKLLMSSFPFLFIAFCVFTAILVWWENY